MIPSNEEERTYSDEATGELIINDEPDEKNTMEDSIITEELNDLSSFAVMVDKELPGDEVVELQCSARITKHSKNTFEAENECGVFFQVFICPVCQGEYCSETGEPRTLQCGHSICSNCLYRLEIPFWTNLQIECPVCRHSHVLTENRNEIPVSVSIKSLILKYKLKKDQIRKSMHPEQHLMLAGSANGDEFILGSCIDHSLPLHFGCTVCNQWLCGKCICCSHSGAEKDCKVFSINEAIFRTREMMIKNLSKRTKELKSLTTFVKSLASSTNHIKLRFIDCRKSINTSERELKIKRNEIQSRLKLVNIKTKDSILLRDQMTSSQDPKEIMKIINSHITNKTYWTFFKESKKPFYRWKYWMLSKKELKTLRFVADQELPGSKYVSIDQEEGQLLLKVFNTKIYASSLIQTNFLKEFSSYYAYIDVGNGNETVRLKFQIDNNALGCAFLRQCNKDFYDSFKGSYICAPFKNSSSFYFGDYYKHTYMHSSKPNYLGNEDQYTKPLTRGAVGLYNNFENSKTIVENSLRVYINMESQSPFCRTAPYITYKGSNNPSLRYCFGHVSEGLEDLEVLMNGSNQMFTISDCGIIINE